MFFSLFHWVKQPYSTIPASFTLLNCSSGTIKQKGGEKKQEKKSEEEKRKRLKNDNAKQINHLKEWKEEERGM